nr:centrosomal protein of 152 kDa isoform X2 [Danio rerio]|eukprot:XP_009296420.1 centrosomal protein of 152 kDa isoform X2 [Danio rerio]
MSIDFDSAALQTQQEEEEYDQEDYAREQELHKLLTDLPDDMLDDSADCSSPELNHSTCSHPEDNNRPQQAWNVPQWEHSRPSHEEHYEEYAEGSYHEDYSYRSHTSQANTHPHHLQPGTENAPSAWDPHNDQSYQYHSGDYAHSSAGTDGSHANDFSTEEQSSFPHNALQHQPGYHEEEAQGHGEQISITNHIQVFNNGAAVNKPTDHFKATYQPHQPSNQPKMFNPQVNNQNGRFDQLQRDFLDSTQNTADGQQLAQLQILKQAQSRQIDELEQKLEDCRRRMRYVEHQFAIVKDEKDGLAVSLKESSTLVEEAKEREAQLQARIRALEKQIQSLTDREQEIVKQQRVAEAAMDSMKLQMVELCRSDTLTRAREQHDRDTAAIREQYEARLLTLQQKLDSQSESLDKQAEAGQRLLDQVRQLERQREEDQMDRASVINTLTHRLEESQQQCAKLLHTGSVQEMSQLQMKLQQVQSARTISEDISKALQDELSELKEQINLYESAIKCGALESNGDWENQLSESYMDLGIKKSKWRNGRIHSTPHISDSNLKEDVVRELKNELQRCLSHLKSKRLKISELQEELRRSQSRIETLETRIQQADRTIRDSQVRESSLEKQLEESQVTAGPQEELSRLQERLEVLEKRNQELKQSEDKLKAVNSELCTKMREMIQELDQEKQEAAERNERTQQQFRDDVVNGVREQLTQEHTAHIQQLSSQHQQQIQQLQSKLTDLSQEVLAVQECYLAVCKEKDKLEENLHNKLEEERTSKEKERLQKSEEEEVRKARQLDTCEGACQTSSSETAGRLISEEELEVQLGAQRDTLLREAAAAQSRAVEEAVRHAEREMLEKHTEDITTQVEGAISRARSRWLQDLTSLPEYKSSLQTEKAEWERLQQQHVQEQVSSAVKSAEERWQDTLRSKCSELEDGNRRLEELQEEVLTLSAELERSSQERDALVKAELAAARDAWIRDKQEDMSRLRVQLQREHKHKLQAVLEQNLEQTGKQRETELQRVIREKEQEWSGEQESRLQEERQKLLEELLQDLKEALQEGEERRESPEDTETTRSRVWEICRQSLSQAKQEWEKSSEDKLRRVLKEAQERHEAEIGLRKQSECGSPACAEALSKLQKKNQDLQRHLEKACRQLQRSVREHKNTLQRIKDEHEAALQKEQQRHLKALEELKQTSNAEALTSGSVGQQNLQAGLEEMKEQYMKAVEKIKGDMLRYLQESKERAAELIKTEVLKERQDTARRMRRYYLTCLQELLEDGGQSAGAEKKIINAASKLAAMAKVLETPVAKRKHPRMQNAYGGSDKTDPETCDSPAKMLGAVSNGAEALKNGKDKQIHQIYNQTYTSLMSKQRAIKPKAFETDSLKPPVASKDPFTAGQVTQKHTHFAHDCVFDSDIKTPNVTLRKQSREMCMGGGFESGRAELLANRPFLIEEAPVRDDGQSDWSLTSNSSSVHLTSSYPGSEKPLLVNSIGGLDFERSIGDNSDVTIYKEIIQPQSYSKPNVFVDRRTNKHREPIPGSEGHGVRKMCPKSLFSELKVHQQDSGFDSPLALLQK